MLLVLSLSDLPVVAEPTLPVEEAAPTLLLERPDQASALITARHSGQKVEVTGQRSETTTIVANPDGTLTMTQAARPVRVRRDNRWVAVDTSLRPAADGGVVPAAAAVDLRLSGGGDGPLLTLAHGGRSLRLGWTLGSLPLPLLDKDTATYPEVLPGVDLRIVADVEGFSQFLVVKTRAAATNPSLRSIRLSLIGDGLTLAADPSGRLSVVDRSGTTVFAGAPSRMWESGAAVAADARLAVEDRRAVGPRSASVGIRVQRNDLLVLPDPALLTDPGAILPIVIDPGLTLARDRWAMVNSQTPTTSYPAPAGNLNVGTQNSGFAKWRSYWAFDTSTLIGTNIVSASLTFNEVGSASCTPSSLDLWGTDWTGENLMWNGQGGALLLQTISVAKGFSASCPAGPVTFDVTARTQGRADAAMSRSGYYLRASSETDNLGWKQFDNNASVSVTYTGRPRVSAHAVESAVEHYVTNGNTALSALVVDPEGSPATTVQFEITNTSINKSFVQEASNVPSGTRASTSLSGTGGAAMTWRVRASDGSGWGAWKPGPWFAFDSTPPAMPIVTSTFPEGGWAGSAHTAGTFTIDDGGTGPVSDVVAYIYGLDISPPTTRVTAAPRPDPMPGEPILPFARVSAAPNWDGPHTFYVRAQDRAGNLGPIKAYQFNVGTGGMSSPLPNDVTASKQTLAAVGRPDASGVTFQWRRADTDSWTDIPAGHVTAAAGGGAVSWPVASTGGGAFPPLVWDTEATLGLADAQGIPRDGGLQVRSVFTGGSGGTSAGVPIAFDRNRSSASTQQVGPGTVNLLTGNLLVGKMDAAVAGLSLGRAMNSRAAGGTDPMFGPGWVSSAIAGGDAPYTDLHVYGSLAQVGLPDGNSLAFTEKTTSASGRTYASPVGAEHLALTYSSATDSYALAHADGSTVTFTHPSGAVATTYAPTSVVAAGSGETTTLSWEKTTVDGVEVVRPTRMRAPVPAGVTCTTLVRGCLALTFAYATSTTASSGTPGDYLGRVSQISFTAWDPDALPPAVRTVAVARYAYDTSGRLVAAWDPRVDWSDEGGVHHLAETYAYGTGGVLATITPSAQEPWQFAYTTLPSDPGSGRLASVARSALTAGTATETVVYKVPIQGSGAPRDLSGGQTARWGQAEPPVDATAVFPPSQVPDGNQATGAMPSSYERANVVYLNPKGRTVNSAQPGGSISSTWYDAVGNVVRTLSPSNRSRALEASTSDSAAEEAALALRESDISTYSADGMELRETLGPERLTALPDGTLVRGRRHVVYTHDQGAPTSGPFHLVTTEVASVQYATGTGLVEADQRTTTTGYNWTLQLPNIVTRDPGGLALATRTAYDVAGRVVTTTTPAGGTTTNTPATQTIVYYRSGAGSGYAECDNRPEWDGLVCRTQPGGQPATGPELPAKVTTYSMYQQPRTVVERTSAGILRTTTVTYDSAGRPFTTAIAGATGTGEAVPVIRVVYDEQTGQPVRTQSLNGVGGVAAEVVRTYDTLGRLTSYQDADANTSTTTYDLLSRPATTADGKATRTYSYDGGTERRGLLTQIVDSQAGTFTAGYDVGGDIVAENRPDGIVVSFSTHEDGSARTLTYTKTGCGQPDCTLYTASIDSTPHGQARAGSSTLSQQRHAYDAAGRLTSVADTLSGACTTRSYAFTTATNRSGMTTYAAAADGSCQTATSASSRTWTFDTADRVNTAGYTYDALGRTLTMPAADSAVASGSNPSMTYHVIDMARTITQGTHSATYTLDVNTNRFRSWVNSASGTVLKINHYSADVDSPVWTNEGDGTYSRNVMGISGLAGTISGVSSTLTWLIANHQGTFVAGVVTGGTGLTFTSEYTENGLPRNSADAGTRRYGWHGASQRSADTPSGLALMGSRLYAPGNGRFLSVDPIYGGSANSYEYCHGDTVGCADESGTVSCYKTSTWTAWYTSLRWHYFRCNFSNHEVWSIIYSVIVYGLFVGAVGAGLWAISGICLLLGNVPCSVAFAAMGGIVALAAAIIALVAGLLVIAYWWRCSNQRGIYLRGFYTTFKWSKRPLWGGLTGGGCR